MSDSREDGMRSRREVLATAQTSDAFEDFQDLIGRYAPGDIWARPGLGRRTCSAITLWGPDG